MHRLRSGLDVLLVTALLLANALLPTSSAPVKRSSRSGYLSFSRTRALCRPPSSRDRFQLTVGLVDLSSTNPSVKSALNSEDPTSFDHDSAMARDGSLMTFASSGSDFPLPSTWQVDLGRPYLLKEIILSNRRDCCKHRLRDIQVEVIRNFSGHVDQGSSPVANPRFME